MSRVILHHWRSMHGLGQANPAICLDQNQNTVDCQDPNCTYGDCGAPSGPVASGGCLDQSQNQVLCIDPNCTYGDCLPSGTMPAPGKTRITVPAIPITAGTVAAPATQIVPRPSPVVSVPLSTASFGMFLENSTLIAGVPNWALFVGVPAVLLLAFGGGRYRVSRRR